LKGLEFVFVELPKFKAESQTDKRMASLWLRFINEIGQTNEQMPDPLMQNEPAIAKAMALMEVSAFNEQELAAYNHSLDEWRTTSILFKGSREEGEAAGLAKGLAKGLAQGEAKRAIEIAMVMKQKGMDASVIAELTGLAVAEIEKL
jgi:predicted transposase/invertase (TIGR01784 family)